MFFIATVPYKPIIFSAPTFDVTQGCIITFTYLGGRIEENKIIFRDNETNNVVYQQITTSSQLKCEIPPNAQGLQNGSVYNITIQVTEVGGDTSMISEPVIIYCFSMPTFVFSNPTNGAVVPNSYLEALLTYSQPQGEILDRYNFTLYDANGQQISFSGDLYDTANLTYSLKNLTDGRVYSLKATGVTQHGFNLEAVVGFTVSYIKPATYTFLKLKNIPEAGAVSITPNIIVAEGKAFPDPPTYINNEEIDLTSDGSYVSFDDGFNIEKDFALKLIVRGLQPYTNIVVMESEICKIVVEYRVGNFASSNGDCGYFELKAFNLLPNGEETINYVTLSNYTNVLTTDDSVFVWFRRYSGAFEIQVEVL